MLIKQTLELNLDSLKQMFGKSLGVDPKLISICVRNKKESDYRESWDVFDGITISFNKELDKPINL